MRRPAIRVGEDGGIAVPAVTPAAREGDATQGMSPTPRFAANASAAQYLSAAPGVGYASGLRAVALRAAGRSRRHEEGGIAAPAVKIRS